jgi:hypothetical protein
MPDPPLSLPPPVLNWIRGVFAEVNHRSATKLSRNANVWETSLDMTVIEQLSQFTAPFRFPSNWIVRLETHYLGGGRYWGKWEIADLGILIVFRKRGRVLATKVALLQSKRLYPDEIHNASEDHELDYQIGFGRLLESDSEYRSIVKPRTFHFSQMSRYRALEYGGEQYKAILKYTVDTNIGVYYLLYNPLALPWTVSLPVMDDTAPKSTEDNVCCRVIAAVNMDVKLGAASLAGADSPSFAQICGTDTYKLDADNWRLETFVADLVLGCKEGYLAGKTPFEDEGLFRVFNGRSGPISAAISVTIDAPDE